MKKSISLSNPNFLRILPQYPLNGKKVPCFRKMVADDFNKALSEREIMLENQLEMMTLFDQQGESGEKMYAMFKTGNKRRRRMEDKIREEKRNGGIPQEILTPKMPKILNFEKYHRFILTIPCECSDLPILFRTNINRKRPCFRLSIAFDNNPLPARQGQSIIYRSNKMIFSAQSLSLKEGQEFSQIRILLNSAINKNVVVSIIMKCRIVN